MTSNFVAATMLLAVASVAAMAVGSSSIAQSSVYATHSDMQITSIQLRDLHNDQKAFIAFTITNTGTSALVSADVSFRDDKGFVTNIVPAGYIDPGESWVERHFVDAQIDNNGRYVLYIKASTADGSYISKHMAVNAI